jgi:hypothetical protein
VTSPRRRTAERDRRRHTTRNRPFALLRWLNDGFVAGERITPGAPWRIRLTNELRGMLADDAPEGWLALHHATRALGVSRARNRGRISRGVIVR